MTLTNGEIVALSIVLWVIGMILAHLRERYVWNNGISRKSGTPWRNFDTDSIVESGYKDDHGNTVWIGLGGDMYPRKDKKQEKTHVRG